MSSASYEDAESFLLTDKTIVKAEQKYSEQHFLVDGIVFQSIIRYMSGTPGGERIPILYSIHHYYYDHYLDNADVLELSDETINVMKEAYRQVRVAEICAVRMDQMMSGSDSEENFRERIKGDSAGFRKERASKDWIFFDVD